MALQELIVKYSSQAQQNIVIAKSFPKVANIENATSAGVGLIKTNIYKGLINQDTILKQPLYTSELGTPVFIDVTFGDKMNPLEYKDLRTNLDMTLPIITFQAILCSVVFPRNIVKTEIQGRNGTVKEYIGEGDAQISFRGIITGTNGNYPAEQVALLRQLVYAPIPVPVISEYLNNLGIDTVVFEDRSFEQEEGGYSYQTFSLNAISDTPQELRLSGV